MTAIIPTRSMATRLAFALLLVTAGCGFEPEPPAPTEPACAPRSTADPARLNIAGTAEGFGMTPPCEATLDFSIARNTELRALEGTIRVLDADGQTAGEAPLSVSLGGPEGGMFRGRHSLAPVAGQSCRQTSIALKIERCADAEGLTVACPDIRVRRSQMLRRLEASAAGVPVCYDE